MRKATLKVYLNPFDIEQLLKFYFWVEENRYRSSVADLISFDLRNGDTTPVGQLQLKKLDREYESLLKIKDYIEPYIRVFTLKQANVQQYLVRVFKEIDAIRKGLLSRNHAISILKNALSHTDEELRQAGILLHPNSFGPQETYNMTIVSTLRKDFYWKYIVGKGFVVRNFVYSPVSLEYLSNYIHEPGWFFSPLYANNHASAFDVETLARIVLEFVGEEEEVGHEV